MSVPVLPGHGHRTSEQRVRWSSPLGRIAGIEVRGHASFAVLWFNLLLGSFNLVPAFPLDGGRGVRALVETPRHAVRVVREGRVVGMVDRAGTPRIVDEHPLPDSAEGREPLPPPPPPTTSRQIWRHRHGR